MDEARRQSDSSGAVRGRGTCGRGTYGAVLLGVKNRAMAVGGIGLVWAKPIGAENITSVLVMISTPVSQVFVVGGQSILRAPRG